ncbi:Scr1 family TA system antitoxin-like transcriptional regulator [Nocardiopsis sp. NPDC101807]|uniref:Scr1 family TA system antitoxin-like transcriptional regulator n=1 Tax=Nocardiopsis sp. NPDC101807 TaxID=3364339 RepID=UPI00380CEB2D
MGGVDSCRVRWSEVIAGCRGFGPRQRYWRGPIPCSAGSGYPGYATHHQDQRPRSPAVNPGAQLAPQSSRPTPSRADIQTIPREAEGHAGLGGSFTVMDMPGNGSFVYVENQKTDVSLKQLEIVALYDRSFAELRSAALPVSVSRSGMEEIRGSTT